MQDELNTDSLSPPLSDEADEVNEAVVEAASGTEPVIPEFGSDEHSDRLEALFKKIYVTAMHDVPICNSAIKVEAIAYGRFEDMWMGALVTPWCMNLMLLPVEESWDGQRTGDKHKHKLPAGSYEFINGAHEDFGPYRMCSLFSPMYEFADHSSAMATAAVALDAVMTAQTAEEQEAEEEAMMAAIMAGAVPEDMRVEPLPNGDEAYEDDEETASELAASIEEKSGDPKPDGDGAVHSDNDEPIDLGRRSFLRGGDNNA